MHRAVLKIEVDQALIGNTHFLGYVLEISDRTRSSRIVTGCFKYLAYGILRPFILEKSYRFRIVNNRTDTRPHDCLCGSMNDETYREVPGHATLVQVPLQP